MMPDHAERHPHLADLHPVGVRPAADHVADRVGQAGQLTEARRPCRRSGQGLSRSRSISAVLVPAGLGPSDVGGVGVQHGRLGLAQGVRHGVQPGILDRTGRAAQLKCGPPSPLGLFLDCHGPQSNADCRGFEALDQSAERRQGRARCCLDDQVSAACSSPCERGRKTASATRDRARGAISGRAARLLRSPATSVSSPARARDHRRSSRPARRWPPPGGTG